MYRVFAVGGSKKTKETMEMATQSDMEWPQTPHEAKTTSTTTLPSVKAEMSDAQVQVQLAQPQEAGGGCSGDDLEQIEARLAPLVQRHKNSIWRVREAAAQARICKLQKEFTERILERSSLVCFKEDAANSK